MSENSKDFDELLDDVMGGTDHSPETETEALKDQQAENAPEKEEFNPYHDEDSNTYFDDSAEESPEGQSANAPAKEDSAQEVEQDEEKEALKRELANYEKRLHDTQRAMHEANTKRAELQKELDSIRSKQKSDDNWFSDADNDAEDKTAELQEKISDLESRQEQIQQELKIDQWVNEAQKLASEITDYKELVFDKLEPMLDETTGDPALVAAYTKWADKSPKGAYEFAKRFFGYQERLENPGNSQRAAKDPSRGKAGLDRINSADFAEPDRRSRNVIEDLFG
jgi:DNA repair exonuclease SbcCD ATPase subunit